MHKRRGIRRIVVWCEYMSSLSELRLGTNVLADPRHTQHCKAMVPEYSKAARGLHPLIPLYAVDCDENRSLCAEQASLAAYIGRNYSTDVHLGCEGLPDS